MDSLNDAFARLANSDRNERKWLHDEIDGLRRIIAAMSIDHEIHVPDRAMMEVHRIQNIEINVIRDEDNRRYVIRSEQRTAP